MSGELIVCWDLADTLGDYFQPKPGIKEFLQKSSIEGVTHFVVTGAKRDHALEELKRYGISQYLQGILSVEDFDNKDCKPYRRASTLMGISDEEVRHRMIVVGDKPTDRPAESESVRLDAVFRDRVPIYGKSARSFAVGDCGSFFVPAQRGLVLADQRD